LRANLGGCPEVELTMQSEEGQAVEDKDDHADESDLQTLEEQ